MEENVESKEVQIKKLEATVKSLSEELIKVGGSEHARIWDAGGGGCPDQIPPTHCGFLVSRFPPEHVSQCTVA